jgi:hypothetical protein
MKHRILTVAATWLFASLALATTAQAVTLVDQAGHPVGGKWQRWADEMKIPTVRRVTLDISVADANAFCGVAGACSLGSLPGQPREIVAAPDAGRDGLYYELGHQFDWDYLNVGNRRFLARAWGDPGARWQDSAAGLADGSEDGLEGVFPQIYADCASGINDQGTDLEVGFVGSSSKYAPPGIFPKINTCTYLTGVGLNRHAAMPGWRHWRYALSSDEPTPISTTTVTSSQ